MTAVGSIYQFDTVEVRPSACQVLRAGTAVSLEPKAFRVLLYLIENRERAVAKDELIRVVWEGAAVTDNALTRIVAQLRRELGDDARQPRFIQTLPTLGYRFVAELRIQPAAAAPSPAPPRRRLGMAASSVSLLLVAASLLWWQAHPRVPEAPIGLRPVQVTTSPGLDTGGSFSPDGQSIVYSSDRSGPLEIYLRPIAGGGRELQLTSDGRQNVEPAWSPDGKSIAYHSAAGHGIWVVPAAGGTPRQISTFGSSPAWSPDSGQVAFRSEEPYSFALFDLAGVSDSTIWTVAADGTRLRQVTTPQNPQGRHASPHWSPDGKRILFASLWTKTALWTVEVPSGDLRQIPADGVPFQGFPVYAPDGRGIYFAGPSRWGGFSIYYVRTSGGRPIEMHEGASGLPLQLAISPDGKRILYARPWSVSQLWQTGGDQPPKALYRDMVVRARLPVFSPDGKHLAYVVQKQGSKDEIWVMNGDGSGAASVTAAPGPQGGPQWNAAGTAILYSYREAGVTQLRRINPRDGSAHVLLQSKGGLGQPHVTADERNVIYAFGNPPNLWKLPLAGGAARQLTFDRESSSFPSLSPDGKWIAYEFQKGNTTQIKIMDVDGGHQQQLTDDAAINWSNSWASDNRRIAYAAFRDGAWNIWWIDRITRERKQLTWHTAFGSFTRNPAWKPGTEQIVYEHWLIQGNIYMVNVDLF